MRVSFFRLAFESVDLKFFSKYEIWTRASCEPHVLAIKCGAHVLNLTFGFQKCSLLFLEYWRCVLLFYSEVCREPFHQE